MSSPQFNYKSLFLTIVVVYLLFVPYVSGLLTNQKTITSTGSINVDNNRFSFDGLHVEGNKLLDAGNQEVTLIGVNFWGHGVSTDGMDGHLRAKGSSVRPEAAWTYQRIRELGFNTIRRTITYQYWRDNRDNYRTKIDQSITWAEEHNLYYLFTLVSWNPDLFPFEAEQGGYGRAEFFWFWKDVAQRYAGKYPNLILALGNEPGGGSTQCARFVEWCRDIVPEIRQYDTEHIILVPAVRSGADLSPYLSDPIQDPNGVGIIYDFHLYWSWAKNECDSQSYNDIVQGINDNSHQWRKVLDVAQRHPTIVGEFGSVTQYPTYASNALKIFKDYGCIGWVAWSWNGPPAGWGGDMLQSDFSTLNSRGQWFVNHIDEWMH
jgi:hypothetical protein